MDCRCACAIGLWQKRFVSFHLDISKSIASSCICHHADRVCPVVLTWPVSCPYRVLQVNYLDELQPYLFVMTTSRQHETVIKSVCSLLNSGVLHRSVSASISLSRLGGLFSFADGGDDIARRNAELLRSAKIVVDVQRLLKYASNPFSQKSATETVRLESGEQRDAPRFRLAGGQTCSKIVGESDIESLFVEIQIQLSSIQTQEQQGNSSRAEHDDIADLIQLVDEVYRRVQGVFELVEHIYKAIALGGEFRNQHMIVFSSQAPEQTRSLYEDAIDALKVDPLHDIKPVWQLVESHSALSEKLNNIKSMFPFVSFVCPRDIMKRKVPFTAFAVESTGVNHLLLNQLE